jgi:hypothetical protein
MHVKLVQMHRLSEQMHNRKGDRQIRLFDRHPDILVIEVSLVGERFIGQVRIRSRAKVGSSGVLNNWERSKVIRARRSNDIGIRHWRCSAVAG